MSVVNGLICEALQKAGIAFDPQDLLNVDMDLDRVYFNLKNEPKDYIIRMWNIGPEEVDYSLYKDNDRGGADEIAAGVYVYAEQE